jgi:two-component system NtrC family response regulator
MPPRAKKSCRIFYLQISLFMAQLLLAHAFLRRFAQEQRRGVLSFNEDAIRAVENHDWPGNVRELLNVVKRAAIMADSQRVGADDLGLRQPAEPVGEVSKGDARDSDLDLRAAREEAERRIVVIALSRTNNNVLKAAELIGVSRPTLYDLMSRLAIK